MDRSPALLVCDIGSSSVRASLWDLRGESVDGTEEQLTYRWSTAADGTTELDADVLCDLVARAIDGALASAPAAEHEIVAVAACTIGHSVVGEDGGGRPVTPLLSWADRRGAGAAARLRERLDEKAVHARTGCVLHSSYWPAKLAWLREAAPEAHGRARRWASPGDHLHRRFFGAAGPGTSLASTTGLLDQHRRDWDAELLDALGLDAAGLGAVADEPRRGLQGEWARRWPALADVPWFPAVFDGACSNLGSGCATTDRAALMVGTSGALRVAWRAEEVSIPPGLWCYRPDPTRFLMGGALSDGGNLAAWLHETLRLPDREEVERLVAAMEPDDHGLTFLPLLGGERGPGWADAASGAVMGLSFATQPEHLLRAALEGVALRFALIAELLDAAVSGERTIVATGGGLLHSPAWTQIMADALGKPIVASAVEEGSSRGAALLALETLGELDDAAGAPAPLGDRYAPDPDRTEVYRAALERQRALYATAIDNPSPPAG